MQKINKNKIATIVVMTILIGSMMAIAAAYAQANLPTGFTNPMNLQEGGSIPLPAGVTPDVTVQTTAFLSFRPNPVGVGQTILVNMWENPALHVSRYFVGYKVTIQKPDGTTETKTLNSFRADTTAYFEYTVDQVGQYKLKFDKPGGYFPAGNYTIHAGAFFGTTTIDIYTNFLQSCYYTPSSTGWQTLTVQQDQVLSWPPSALPTDYWTRPVQPDNREWASILGDFPWYGPGGGSNWPADTNIYTASQYRWTPYVTAPNTAHIAWMRQGAIGGMLGGSYGDWSSSSGGGNPSIVFEGRAYQTWTKANPNAVGSLTYLQSYDLRTGQLYWERPMQTGEPTPTAIEYDPGHGEVPGSGDSPLGLSQNLIGFSSGRMYKFSLWTGAMTANYSIAPLTTATYEMNGYALGIQTIGTQYRLINFTTFNNYQSTTNPLNALNVVSNITWPWNTVGMLDLQSGYAAQMSSITPPAVGAFYGTWIRGANLLTGVQTFNITDPGTLYSGSCTVADHGKVAGLMMGGYFKAWDLATGTLAWQGQAMAYPWSQPAFGAYSIQSAYGLFYREAYDGVYAFKWTDGSIAWRFAAPANPYETPYTDVNGSTLYSFNAGGILADGKIFVYNTEHTPSQPITRGWRLFCVDAKTGAGIWNITGTMSPGVIADGYLTASNGYDGYMYVFGKGKSAASVTATPAVIANGATVLVQGTVMDQSPAQPNTPCVSKDSMTTQMEYLHMQLPVDGIWHNVSMTGVPVLLTAIDSSGAVTSIGTVTTNPYYGTFSMPWTPSKQDTYTITASFAGDDSYGSSSAATAVNVGPAPQTANTTTQPAQTVDNTPLYYALAGAAVAIILAIAVATVLILRKK